MLDPPRTSATRSAREARALGDPRPRDSARPPRPTLDLTIEYHHRSVGDSVSPLRARVSPRTLHYIAYSAPETPS
jgi:hypothetical protein